MRCICCSASLDERFRPTMVALSERCVQTAPTASLRVASEGWRKANAEGRRVKTGVYPVKFLERVPRALSEEVEDALRGVTEE